MKKFIAVLLVLLISVSFYGCREENADNTIMPGEGEIKLTATVKQATDTESYGATLLLCDADGKEYVFGCDENVTIIENGAEISVLDSYADYFTGKKVTVIVSELMQETYPLGLTGERVIIIEKE